MSRRRNFQLLLSGFMCSSFLLTLDSLVKVVVPPSLPTHTNLLAVKLNIPQQEQERCALLFFGLPRSYEALVLPSIVENVLKPNLYCDVFVHAPIMTHEAPGRSGRGGTIDPNAIYLIQDRELELYNNNYNNTTTLPPHVSITTDSEASFWKERNATIQKYRTTISNTTGKLLYHPWATSTYVYPTTMDNIVRQWHSMNAVWNLMESHSLQQHNIKYTRVAMLRSDVFYATPIDISVYDSNQVVLPGFAMYPVNDRMVIGGYESVKIWATQRFQRLDEYVITKVPKPGLGMHSEHYLNKGILPVIMETTNATSIYMDPSVCFWRVRADSSVWISDCDKKRIKGAPSLLNYIGNDKKQVVERISGLQCQVSKLNRAVTQAVCHDDTTSVNDTTDSSDVIDCGCVNSCDVSQTRNGLPFSCQQRVSYLITTYGQSMSEACSTAAQGGGACAPECDSQQCKK